MRTEIQHPIVFLDTNVLLKAFSAHRKGHQPPIYVTDSEATRFTFEKCVFEAYMAFRGVGGKKPDEGRGNWAQSNLRDKNDPKPLDKLSNKFHDGYTSLALFWINQILEFEYTFDSFDEIDGRDEAIKSLRKERILFETLCRNFWLMLSEYKIAILSYLSVFGDNDSRLESAHVSPEFLDGLVKDTIIPSEDFEIVYAALRLRADIFVTDDKKLRQCAMSLGLNLPLSQAIFCNGSEYESKVQEWREWNK